MFEIQGTWYFMSARLLQDPRKSHEVQDDLESFFYVVLFNALRYTRHNLTASDPGSFMRKMQWLFEDRVEGDGRAVGGSYKLSLIRTGGKHLGLLETGPLRFARKPMEEWYQMFLKSLSQWYQYNLEQQVKDRAEALQEDDFDSLDDEDDTGIQYKDLLLRSHEHVARQWKLILDRSESYQQKIDAVADQLPDFDKRVVDPIYPHSGAESDIASMTSSISHLSSTSVASSAGSKRKSPTGGQETPNAKRPHSGNVGASSSLRTFPPVAKLQLGEEAFFGS